MTLSCNTLMPFIRNGRTFEAHKGDHAAEKQVHFTKFRKFL